MLETLAGPPPLPSERLGVAHYHRAFRLAWLCVAVAALNVANYFPFRSSAGYDAAAYRQFLTVNLPCHALCAAVAFAGYHYVERAWVLRAFTQVAIAAVLGSCVSAAWLHGTSSSPLDYNAILMMGMVAWASGYYDARMGLFVVVAALLLDGALQMSEGAGWIRSNAWHPGNVDMAALRPSARAIVLAWHAAFDVIAWRITASIAKRVGDAGRTRVAGMSGRHGSGGPGKEPLAAGDAFGRYRIMALLGRGGMGVVYRARDTHLERTVALKVLRDEAGDESAAARLLREGRSAAAIQHPNAVAIFDVGEWEGTPFLAMELVEGRTLRAFVSDRRGPVTRRLRWLLEIASALAAAHKEGVVHRDVKPENAIVGEDRSVKLLDFGIAGWAGRGPGASGTRLGSGDNAVVGSLRYMAPEQLRGESLDGRADQFAWGVVAFELLTGRHPWSEAKTEGDLAQSILERDVPFASALPAAIESVLQRATEKEPGRRYESMEELIKQLRSLLSLEAESEGEELLEAIPLPRDCAGGIGDDDQEEQDSSGAFGELLRAVARSESREPPGGDNLVGSVLGHYRVIAELGRGGMGVVYLAEDARLARDVALKVLPESLAGDEGRRRRFLREARTAAAINHPNIATIYEVGEAGGRLFLAMERVEGVTLRAALCRGGPIAPPEALRIARQIALGLARAHERGIVHRDLKPENVMVTAVGELKILDFGLAKLCKPASNEAALASETTRTQKGRVMGTPGYMSPEQAAGEDVDERTDVYALGVLLHEMLTGELPGALGSGKVVATPEVAEIVTRCLTPAREDRWASALDLLCEIDALSSRGENSRRSRVGAGR